MGAIPRAVTAIILMESLMYAHATGIGVDARQPSDPIGQQPRMGSFKRITI